MQRLLLVVTLAIGYGAGCMGEQAVSPSEGSESKALSGGATAAGLACYNLLKAEVDEATPELSKIEAECVPAGAMTSSASNSDGPDPGLVAWCDEGGCCIAGDTGPICCWWIDGTWGCG